MGHVVANMEYPFMALSMENFIIGQFENLNYLAMFSKRLQYPTKIAHGFSG
jgi:hypothetical protein